MTTSRFKDHRTLLDLSGMNLGLWEAIELRTQKKYKESRELTERVRGRVTKLKKENWGLESIREYLKFDPDRYLESINKIANRLKTGRYSAKKLIEEIDRNVEQTTSAIHTIEFQISGDYGLVQKVTQS